MRGVAYDGLSICVVCGDDGSLVSCGLHGDDAWGGDALGRLQRHLERYIEELAGSGHPVITIDATPDAHEVARACLAALAASPLGDMASH